MPTAQPRRHAGHQRGRQTASGTTSPRQAPATRTHCTSQAPQTPGQANRTVGHHGSRRRGGAGPRGGRLAARSVAADTQVSNFAGVACCARTADLAQVSLPGAVGGGAHIWLVRALVCVVGQAGLRLALAVSDDRPGSAAPGAGVGVTASGRHPPGPSPSSRSWGRLRCAGLADGPDLARGCFAPAAQAHCRAAGAADEGPGMAGEAASLRPGQAWSKLPDVYS
jgi:hypothetical protein